MFLTQVNFHVQAFFFSTGKEKIKSSYSSVIQENERKCLEMKNN